MVVIKRLLQYQTELTFLENMYRLFIGSLNLFRFSKAFNNTNNFKLYRSFWCYIIDYRTLYIIE